jgi:hypothetical protein
MHGVGLLYDYGLRLLHLSQTERQPNAPPPSTPRATPERLWSITRPRASVANPDGWGRAFDRRARDWAGA